MPCNKYQRISNSGFTLIELMIAIALQIFIINLLIELYVGTQRSVRQQNELRESENSVHLAQQFVDTAIKQAGNIGCGRLSADFPLISHGQYSITSENKFYAANAHEMIVRYSHYPFAVLEENNQTEEFILTSKEVRFQPGQLVIISDCQHAEIAEIKKIEDNKNREKIILTSALQTAFLSGAEVAALEINHYYVAKTARHHLDGSPVYALFVEEINHRKTELVSGIKNLTCQYLSERNNNWLLLSNSQIQSWSEVNGVACQLELSGSLAMKPWYFISLMGAGKK